MAYSRPGVYITERVLPPVLQGGVTADAAGAVVAPFAQGPETVTLVKSWYEFTSYFGGYNASYPATFQVGAFFSNGGKELYVQRLLADNSNSATATIYDSSENVVAYVNAKNAGTDGNNLRIVIADGSVANTYTLYVYKESGVANDITDDILLERYENIVFDDPTSSDYADTVINTVSANITVNGISESGTPDMTNPYPLSGGTNGSTPAEVDYTNYKDGSTSVFERFTALDRPLVIFLPNLAETYEGADTVYDAAIAWAEENKSFVIVETWKGASPANAISYVASLQDSSHAAAYYPWTYIADPLGRGTGSLRLIGPSGAIAGLYLETDTSRGVFKAPAGIGASVRNIVATERSFTSTELDSMNASTSPVNPIRQIPGAGLSVMGARTLLQDGTANKYVNMRRSLNYIEKQLSNLTQFAIFENNDENLWARIRTVLNVFLNDYKNRGGLRGATPDQAYFIKCDAENNTATSIANGEVRIQVGVALQYPAEFIVIDLSQKSLV